MHVALPQVLSDAHVAIFGGYLMTTGRATLASLVTQASDDDPPHSSSSHPHSRETGQPKAAPTYKVCADRSQATEECPCRCFFWRSSEPKLASVVPVVTEEKEMDEPAPLPVDDSEAEESANAGNRNVRMPQPAAPPRPAAPVPKVYCEVAGQLSPQAGNNIGRKTLVLDLDETLVHSSFRVVHAADIVITVELEGEHHRVFVRKRPGVDEFLKRVAQLYEVVVYTASMAKYANPLLDELDRDGVVSFRLFREACTRQPGGYVKDLSKLGRNLKDVIIIDNSPTCYALQPNNAIPIKTWRDDPCDRELLDLIPILYSLADVEDIPMVLTQIVWTPDD